mmetsp:Transcript_73888/g.135107  ORF Transcript_73888/g.135107 Transcript_73888/m.135107 type:complete len:88 (-) Transcript_73888:139-402(-)
MRSLICVAHGIAIGKTIGVQKCMFGVTTRFTAVAWFGTPECKVGDVTKVQNKSIISPPGIMNLSPLFTGYEMLPVPFFLLISDPTKM